MNNKVTQEPTYIHSLCRTNTNNNTWANWTSDAHVKKVRAKSIASENFNFSIRSTEKNFNFKKHCFYCTKVCEYDDKHPGQNEFECVQTMDLGILKTTLTIYWPQNDKYWKVIKMSLLSVSDVVVVEAKYHKLCLSSFQNLSSTRSTPGRPNSEGRMSVFLWICGKFEVHDMEICILWEFHEFM